MNSDDAFNKEMNFEDAFLQHQLGPDMFSFRTAMAAFQYSELQRISLMYGDSVEEAFQSIVPRQLFHTNVLEDFRETSLSGGLASDSALSLLRQADLLYFLLAQLAGGAIISLTPKQQSRTLRGIWYSFLALSIMFWKQPDLIASGLVVPNFQQVPTGCTPTGVPLEPVPQVDISGQLVQTSMGQLVLQQPPDVPQSDIERTFCFERPETLVDYTDPNTFWNWTLFKFGNFWASQPQSQIQIIHKFLEKTDPSQARKLQLRTIQSDAAFGQLVLKVVTSMNRDLLELIQKDLDTAAITQQTQVAFQEASEQLELIEGRTANAFFWGGLSTIFLTFVSLKMFPKKDTVSNEALVLMERRIIDQMAAAVQVPAVQIAEANAANNQNGYILLIQSLSTSLQSPAVPPNQVRPLMHKSSRKYTTDDLKSLVSHFSGGNLRTSLANFKKITKEPAGLYASKKDALYLDLRAALIEQSRIAFGPSPADIARGLQIFEDRLRVRLPSSEDLDTIANFVPVQEGL